MKDQALERMKLDFIADATERIEKMAESLYGLNPLDGYSSLDVDSLFRTAHSLKGTAGMFELGDVSTLSGAIENLLGHVRSGSIAVDADVVDMLVEAFDEILTLFAKAAGKHITTRAHEVLEKLENFVSQHGLTPSEGTTPKSLLGMDLNRDELESLRSQVRQGKEIIVASFSSLEDDLSQDVLLRQLHEAGEIIAIRYGDSQPASMTIVMASHTHYDALERVVKQSGGDLRRVTSDIVGKPSCSSCRDSTGAGPSQQVEVPELRVKVNISTLDRMMNSISELRSVQLSMMGMVNRIPANNQTRRLRDDLLKLSIEVSKRITSLETTLANIRLVPVSTILERFRREIRRLSRKLSKRVELVVEGEATLVDKALLERIYDPILHIIRNAVSHGIENPEERLSCGKPQEGKILIRASQVANQLQIEIVDDGRGIDTDRILEIARAKGIDTRDANPLDLLFLPGFSTKSDVDDVSGRGVGLDAVKCEIEKLRGSVSLSSIPRRGTSVSILVPLTLTLSRGVLVGQKTIPCVLPLSEIGEVMRMSPAKKISSGEKIFLKHRGMEVEVFNLSRLFGIADSQEKYAVLTQTEKVSWALAISDIGGEVDIVSRSLPHTLSLPQFVSGATELVDGRAALIIHPEQINHAPVGVGGNAGKIQDASEVSWDDLVKAKTIEVMVFSAANTLLGLPTSFVKEVTQAKPITHLPLLHPLWDGICFVRGTCHGVVCLSGDGAASLDPSRLIVLHQPQRTVIAADEIESVMEISTEKISVKGTTHRGRIVAHFATFTSKRGEILLLYPMSQLQPAATHNR